jgi:hypothetical protein
MVPADRESVSFRQACKTFAGVTERVFRKPVRRVRSRKSTLKRDTRVKAGCWPDYESYGAAQGREVAMRRGSQPKPSHPDGADRPCLKTSRLGSHRPTTGPHRPLRQSPTTQWAPTTKRHRFSAGAGGFGALPTAVFAGPDRSFSHGLSRIQLPVSLVENLLLHQQANFALNDTSEPGAG